MSEIAYQIFALGSCVIGYACGWLARGAWEKRK